MTLKQIIGKVHLWLGLTSGLVVFIIGITGCIWAFEEEISSVMYEDIFTVQEIPASQDKRISESLFAGQQRIGSDIPAPQLYITNDPQATVVVRARKFDSEAPGIWYWNELLYDYKAYVNPYTAEVISKRDESFEFFNFVLWLHRTLLLKYDTGTTVTGTATLIFVFMLMTGLVLWWPKNKKAFKVNTWFRWKETTKWRRKNYDLHNIVGFYSMFLVIFIALTGLMWAFTWFSDSVEWIANGGKTMEKEPVEVVSTIALPSSDHALDIVHHSLKTEHNEAKVFYINLPQDSTGTIGTYVDYKDNTRDVYLQFDQYSGELLHTGDKWEDKTNGEKVWAYNYDIHTGAIGGLVGKTIAFFLSLFAASLPVTGFLIWYGRTFKKRKRRPVRKKPVALQPSEST